MDIREFLIGSGFEEDADQFTKVKHMPFASDSIRIELKVVIFNLKYIFSVDLYSPVFIVSSEKSRRIDSLNWSSEIINNMFKDLIKSAFNAVASDVIDKALPIEDRY